MDMDKPSCLITCHNTADADAFGSMIGAHKLFPSSYLFWPGSPNETLEQFIQDRLTSTALTHFITNLNSIDINSINTLVIVDTRKVSRLRHVDTLMEKCMAGLVDMFIYDHHPDSEEDIPRSLVDRLGEDHVVVEICGSASSIMAVQLEKLGDRIELTPDEATWIGMGIYEDTGSFMYSTTGKIDFQAAAFLSGKGMKLQVIYDYLNTRTTSGGAFLTNEESVIYLQLLESSQTYTLHDKQVIISSASGEREIRNFSTLVQRLMTDKKLNALFALGSFERNILLVARSSNKDFLNVGDICTEFGGGGHYCAASARIKDSTLNEVRERLFGILFSKLRPDLLSIKNLITTPVVSIKSNQTISEACTIFRNFNLKRIPVLNTDTNYCIGIADRVQLEKASAHGLSNHSVTEFMETEFFSANLESSSHVIIDTILLTNQRLVPVIDPKSNHIIGVITRADVITTLMKEPGRFPMLMSKKEINLGKIAEQRLTPEIYKFLRNVGQLADELNCNVYVAGGIVRDLVLNKPNDDVDLVVEGDGVAFADVLNERFGQGKVIHHHQFKTAVATLKSGLKIDVSTARLEYYPEPVALPTVELSSLKMDLYRRDFTMNAMAMQLNISKFGTLLDFFNGMRDIDQGTINVLHSLSFVEDPTRILRAIRFQQRYGFKLSNQTERLIKNSISMGILNKLSGSRLWHEIEKILKDSKPENCVLCLEGHYNILSTIHPAFKTKFHMEQFYKAVEIKKLYDTIKLKDNLVVWKFYYFVMTHFFNYEEAQETMQKFLFPSGTIKQILEEQSLIKTTLKKIKPYLQAPFNNLGNLFFLLKEVSLEGNLVLMVFLDQEDVNRQFFMSYLINYRHKKADINGNDLKKLGFAPGKAFAEVLREVLRAKLDGEVSDKQSQLDYAKKLLEKDQIYGKDS